MNKLQSELKNVQAANESHYTPGWMAEMPDDWSHTILISSEYPVMHRRYDDMGAWHDGEEDHHLNESDQNQPIEDQSHSEAQTIRNNAKAA